MKPPAGILTCLRLLAAAAAAAVPMSYVRVMEPYSPSRDNPAADFDMARVTTTYFDGLGRPVETVRTGAGGDFEDVAELTVYYGAVQRVGGKTRRLEWSGGFFTKDDGGRWHSHRYVRNSLGSIVAVTDSAGTVEQAVGYYASGLPVYKTPDGIPATRRMHVGKELEQFESLDLYDNEARFYDPMLMRFTTPDPLALSYPSLSPYAYCANNPVNRVDLDGKKIRFAKGVSSEFKQQFSTAIKILNEHNIGGIFAKLEQRPEIIFITEGKNQFDPSNNTISWNPTEGMITDILNFLSPVVFLNHEGAHGLRYLEDPEGIMKDKHTEDSQYGNKEEKRVIEGIEQKTAEALGEVEPGEPTRINHFGTPIIVGSPNSTEPISSPEIIYKRETK